MSVIYVVHEAQDRPFVENRLIRPLPAIGFSQWLASWMLQDELTPVPSILPTMEQSAAILVVVSASALASQWFVDEVEAALQSTKMVITVYLGSLSNTDQHPVLTGLGKAAGINVPETTEQFEPRELWRVLTELLPPPDGAKSHSEIDKVARRIDWNEETFSSLLKELVDRHDYSRSEALIGAFQDHIEHRPYPYAATHAHADLRTLRKKRQFLLIRSYASAALKSGMTDFQTRRQYAQALIELKEFEQAERVLLPLIEHATTANDDERFEARGLLARSYKQRYVDSGTRSDGSLLERAIEIYWSVFREDQQHVWHGINAASCILRAHRDGIEAPPVAEAHAIAKTILDILQDRQTAGADRSRMLDVWDYATRVEALIDLEEFDKASKALDDYLAHPAMEAFEASSTYRQFDEVLQIENSKHGAALLHRLAKAAERLRNGGLLQVDEKGAKPMLVRVSDPEWTPVEIPDLVLHERLDTIISISGSDRTVRALLKDPLVTGIEESRPSGQFETARSLPFIRVAEEYQGLSGSFSECGSGALIAIIDNDIDVLHETFLDAAGQSRIIGIWDQQDNDEPRSPPPGCKFGRFHTQEDVAKYVAGKTVPASLSRKSDGHGTLVASIAAGRRVGTFAGGVAPEAQLLIVISKSDQPTGYSHAHMAALSFIKKVAIEVGKPVVVNLSQGMNAGAHDGRSPLENMFDAFSKGGTTPGRVVVKSAGNERDKRGHAKLTIPVGGAEKLLWRCPPGSLRVQLELWWHSANQYRFQLKSPSGDLSDWVDESNPDLEGYFKKRGKFQLKLVKLHPDNGDNMLKIVHNNGVAPIAMSDWTLDIEALRVPAKGDIHAWIERGGNDPTEFICHDSEEMTLSIPGTSHSVITVGAIDSQTPIRVGDFSSYGPTRDNREKPDISAPGVQVRAALQNSVNGVIAKDGTSMAAPHVTGAIALLLSKMARAGEPIPTATQINAVLRQKTINYSAQWDRGQGYGVLDVAALLNAF